MLFSPHCADGFRSSIILLCNGTGALAPGIKALKRECNHSTLSRSEVKTEWNNIISPTYVRMACRVTTLL